MQDVTPTPAGEPKQENTFRGLFLRMAIGQCVHAALCVAIGAAIVLGAGRVSTALGIVLASKGYPGSYAKGAVIEGLDEVDGAVYHMGTASKEGRIVTAGGRVAIVVCAAPTLGEALEKCNREVGKVRCDNLFHRTDIGRKAIK